MEDLTFVIQFVSMIIGVVLGTVLVIFLLLFAVRRRNMRNSTLRDGATARQTFLIRVPKFGSDGDVKQGDSTAKIQEDISIAETFYAALGGLPAQKGLKAWLSGRTDEIALELAAHDKLIHFYLTVPVFMKEFIEQQLHAQYPDASIEPIDDYNIFSPDSVEQHYECHE